MPGFSIGGSPGVPSVPSGGRNDWFREHRYRLIQLMSIKSISASQNGELLALRDVKLPTKSISELAVETPATTYKFAKSAKYTDLGLTFYGSRKMLELILAMHDVAHNIRSGVGDFNLYKDIVEFVIYDKHQFSRGIDDVERSEILTGPDNAVTYKFYNSWISDVDHGSLTYTSSEIKTISCNIKFDFYDVLIDDKPIKGSLSGNNQSTLQTGI